jgi:hypothetical protein
MNDLDGVVQLGQTGLDPRTGDHRANLADTLSVFRIVIWMPLEEEQR